MKTKTTTMRVSTDEFSRRRDNYSNLAKPPKKKIRKVDQSAANSHNPGGPRSRTMSVPDYDAIAPEDENPGFNAWLQAIMGGAIDRIRKITDQTDSSFVW